MNFISKFMDTDHSYLDALWLIFLEHSQNLDRSLYFFHRFKKHFLLHIRLEDDFLFPRLSQYLKFGPKSALVALASKDHRTILKLLAFVEEAIAAKNFAKVKIFVRHLAKALSKHRAREMKIHYPVSDYFIPLEEWKQMIKKIYRKDIYVQKKIIHSNYS